MNFLPESVEYAGTKVPTGPWLLLGMAVTEFRLGEKFMRRRNGGAATIQSSAAAAIFSSPTAAAEYSITAVFHDDLSPRVAGGASADQITAARTR